MTKLFLPAICLATAAWAQSASPAVAYKVDSTAMFNNTGLFVHTGEALSISGAGIVNLSSGSGGYYTVPTGKIEKAPAPGTAAYDFFTNNADPIGTPPMAGGYKTVDAAYVTQLPGGPYGALVGGFSPIGNPTSLSDFPNGFFYVGKNNVVTATFDSYLFLAVNDNNPIDNVGSYVAFINEIVHDPVLEWSAQNPSGVWTYLGSVPGGTTLNPLNTYFNYNDPSYIYCWVNSVNSCWWNSVPYPSARMITQTISTGDSLYSSIDQPPEMLRLDPEDGTLVVRFTAPSNGIYGFEGRFQMIDTQGDLVTVSVVCHEPSKDKTLLPETPLSGFGNSVPFRVDVPLAANSTVDFIVTAGGSPSFESTGLQADVFVIQKPMPTAQR